MDVRWWLCLAISELAGKKKITQLILFLDVFFPPFLPFVSETAHSCWITGFNRLLLCSLVFQILRPAPRMLPTQTEEFDSQTRLRRFGNKALLDISCSANRATVMSSEALLFLTSPAR